MHQLEKVDYLEEQITLIQWKWKECSAAGSLKVEEAIRQLDIAKQINKDFVIKLEDQIILTSKVELACKAKEELTDAKNEIINNLNTIIGYLKKDTCKCKLADDQMTSNININDGTPEEVLKLRCDKAIHGFFSRTSRM